MKRGIKSLIEADADSSSEPSSKRFKEETHNPIETPKIAIPSTESLILQKYKATLPAHLNLQDVSPLIRKLHTAFIANKVTCAIGSATKSDDYEKTNRWSLLCHWQYFNGGYTKNRYTKKWFLNNLDISSYVHPIPHAISSINPLKENDTFCKNQALANLIETAVKVSRQRVASSMDNAKLLAVNLWRNAALLINRIEVVIVKDFFLSFVIINRKNNSDILDSKTWGDAWILNPWWEEGRFYHAFEYNHKMLDLHSYYINQKASMEKKEANFKMKTKAAFDQGLYDQMVQRFALGDFKVPLDTIIDLDVRKIPYPKNTLDTKMVEDYYDFSPYLLDHQDKYRERAMNEKAEHKIKFHPCLNEIEALQGIPLNLRDTYALDCIQLKNQTAESGLLKKHHATLPAHLNLKDVSPLIRKLHTALIANNVTCALGSGNKSDDHEKTNGWSHLSHLQREYNNNGYSKDPATKKWTLNNLWHRSKVRPIPHAITSNNPLRENEIFSKNNALTNIIQTAVKLSRERTATCCDKSKLLAAHLWCNADLLIDRIEVVGAKDFDHVWVIINRKKNSDILDPQTWGDAWIVDPWWGDGVFYHAFEYKQRVLDVHSYCVRQKASMEKKVANFNTDTKADSDKRKYNELVQLHARGSYKVPLDIITDIDVKNTPYPKNTIDSRKVEDFYDFSPYRFTDQMKYREAAMSEKAAHQIKFKSCVQEIEHYKKNL
ncbi:MAG: hypothetical protein JSS07_08280 [Proteobacteria bacterium]|nr:hypothetical protein [Pseudomonadota bacterium]